MSSDREQLLRDGYAAFDRGDFDETVRLLHPDFAWKPSQSSPNPEATKSRDEFRKLMEPDLFELQRVEAREMIVRDDMVLVAAHFRIRGRGSGIEIESTVFHCWTFEGDLATSCAVYETRDEALGEFEQG